ncbi:hypothetical protein JYT16_02565, partial [Gemmatimonas aurantiaca]|nr:hypothetical protein [Gemmatimonas aurantiaca]
FELVVGIDTVQFSVGGAVACAGASITMRDLVMRNNTAYFGGAVICGFDANATLIDCEFHNNSAVYVEAGSAEGQGGALSSVDSDVTLSKCSFTGNFSNFRGGAIDAGSESGPRTIRLDSCYFTSNSADTSGGGISTESTSLQITNSLFLSNSTVFEGGAIFIDAATDTSNITNCTFVGNSSTGSNGYGSVFHCDEEGATIFTRCILTGNTGGDVTIGCTTTLFLTINCTDIWGNSPGDWDDCLDDFELANGNFSADPYFCLTDSLDFHIDTNSPCAPANSPCLSLVGAYGTACSNLIGCCVVAGDANFDNKVTIGDVTFLISRLFTGGLAPDCCEEGDADGSGTINIGDVTKLIGFLFTGGSSPECGSAGMICSPWQTVFEDNFDGDALDTINWTQYETTPPPYSLTGNGELRVDGESSGGDATFVYNTAISGNAVRLTTKFRTTQNDAIQDDVDMALHLNVDFTKNTWYTLTLTSDPFESTRDYELRIYKFVSGVTTLLARESMGGVMPQIEPDNDYILEGVNVNGIITFTVKSGSGIELKSLTVGDLSPHLGGKIAFSGDLNIESADPQSIFFDYVRVEVSQ